MPSRLRLPVYSLNVHQGYRCQHSGVCCAAGWDIAIDPRAYGRVVAAIDTGDVAVPAGLTAGRSPFILDPGLPDGSPAILARTQAGDCAFFDRSGGRLCAIHRGLGHESLPSVCRHFPRVILIDDEGVFVTYSHVCPTTASMLFRNDVEEAAVVTDPGVLSGPDDLEGFDARGNVPPFVKPGVLFDQHSRREWETFLVSACGRRHESVEQVLVRLARGADRVRAWTPAVGGMARYLRIVLAETLGEPVVHARTDLLRVVTLYSAVVECVPQGLRRPTLPDHLEQADRRWATPVWTAEARAIRRYLAARAFAAWSAYLGEGVRTQVAVLAAALAVLRVEVARRGEAACRPLDAASLCEAIGCADMLTVHQSREADVCRRVSGVERLTAPAFLSSLGVTVG